MTFYDNDAYRQLNAAMVSLTGVAGPTPLLRCSFGGPIEPGSNDFITTVLDASDIDAKPISAKVAVASVVCSLFACPPVPSTVCLESAKALLQVKDNAADTRDQIKWKWSGGAAVVQGNLGNPGSATTYTLCVYDSTGGVDVLVGSLRDRSERQLVG